MLYVCGRDVMDVVFSVCNVTRGAVGARVWKYQCSSCRCCMFVFCVYPVTVLNAAYCMTCSLLTIVEDARGNHMEEAYSRAGLMNAL